YEREDNGQLAAIRARGPVNCEADEDYDGPYAEQFRQLLQMLSAAAAKSGYRTESYDASDDLDSLRPHRQRPLPATPAPWRKDVTGPFCCFGHAGEGAPRRWVRPLFNGQAYSWLRYSSTISSTLVSRGLPGRQASA